MHAPERAPKRMLSAGVEANTLRDGELLPERESKQRSELVPKNETYGIRRISNDYRIERSVQALAETGYVEEERCYPPP